MTIQDSTFPLQYALLLFRNNSQHQHQPQQHQDDKRTSSTPVHVTDEDLQWSVDELTTLFTNETKQLKPKQRDSETETTVKWIMKLVTFFNFHPTTGILAVDYFDRFISIANQKQRNVEKPWTLQLTAVACLSIAAKIEEAYPPMLVDIQVEEAKFVFEAKTIQRMELLVLSTLQWLMYPVTPFSYIHHFIRRLGFKSPNLQFQFFDHSSRILTSLVTDGRWVLYPSSALAYATMLHVMEMELDYNSSSNCAVDDVDKDDQTQLFSGLITTIFNKEKVSECYKLIQDLNIYNKKKKKKKRMFGLVMDHAYSSSSSSYDLLASDDTSNDSWNMPQSQSQSQQQQPFWASSLSELPLQLPAWKRTRYTNGEEDEVKDHNFEILE